MKKLRTTVVGLLVILAAIGFVGCSNFLNNAKDINPADAIETAKNNLSIGFAASDTATTVTQTLTLATVGDEDVSISWVSSNPQVVTNTGVVTRPAFGQPDVAVTLTATITKNGITEIKTFEIKVAAYPDSSHADVLAAKESLTLGFTGSDTAEMVTGNLALDLTGANDVAISWATSDASVVSAAGVVSRPAAGQSDAEVTLTATLTKGTETETKTFTVTIKVELHRYMVTYDGNGSSQGTVPTDSNRYLANAEVTVTAQGDLRKTGYSFVGWNTRADGGGTDYAPAASFQMPGESLTLYAKWTANGNTAYSLQHYKQDVSGSGYTLFETESLSGTTGSTATAVAKSYTGFTENTGHASRVASGTIAADGSLVLKLYYSRSTYTVSFSSDGGTAVSSTTGVRYGATISAPVAPTKTGYTFAGWYKESGLTNVWTFASDTVTATTTLYAKWTANTGTAYSVQHYKQDVSGSGYTLFETESLSGTTGSTATAVAKSYTGFAENTGHASRVASGTIAADGSLALKLYYSRSTYTVSFSSDGGTAVSSTTGVRYGATISAPVAPTKTGYTFAGWYKESGLTNVWTFASDTVTTATTLYAKWTANTYTVTFNAQTGTAASPASKSVTYASTYGALATTTRIGYTFSGWYTGVGGTGTNITSSSAVAITTDQTLYAKWTANTGTAYSVQHYKQDVSGSGYTLFETESLSGTTDTMATAVAKSYTGFAENTGHASRVASGTIAADGSLVLKLYYSRSTYTVSFSSDGGTAVSSTTGVRYGATISAPVAPTKTGYTFAGWYKESGLTNAWTFASDTVTTATTLYAKWTANTYTVTFNAQTGSAASPASKSVTYASTYGTLATTTRTGYTFSGWYTGTGGGGTQITASSTVAITANQTLYAYWVALSTYTVTYSGNGSGAGTVPTDANRYLAEASATVLGNTGSLYKSGGYYFDGWNTNAAGSGTDYAPGDTLTIQGNLTLYAQWTKYVVTKHVVIFRDDGSEWNQPSTYGDLLANEIGMTEGTGIAKYEYKTSADIPAYTPTVGDILIIAASQPTAFYDAYRTNKATFDSFVNAGGVMFWVYSDCGMPWGRYDSELPGGVLKSYSAFENYDDIVNSTHPITAGITSTHFYGSQASAGGFSNLDSLVSAGTISSLTTLIVQSSNRLPSLVEYSYGSGKVLAATVILDYYVSSSKREPYYTIAVNSLKYLLELM